jgi:predicted MFS family arabinose efflux permease
LAQSFGGPAYSALVPTLVSREDLRNAIALNSIQFNLARVVGPMLGGIALNNLGASWCFGLNGLSFVAVIISLLMIRVNFVPEKTQQSVIESMQQGIEFIRRREGMTSLVILAFLLTLLSYPLITFLPVMAREVLHGGSNIFTLLLCLSGLGSVIGALLVAGIQDRIGQAKHALLIMLLLGALMAGFGISRNLVLSSALVFGAGASLMIVFASNSSLVQLNVRDTMRGRVMSVYNVAFRGGMPFGSLISGFLIKQTSAPAMMLLNGLLVIVLALYFLVIQRRLSKL